MNINDAAAYYLSYRSRSEDEMRKHLQKKGYEDDKIEQVIRDFRDAGYLNDSRYCMEYFNYAFSNGKGKKRAFSELREKGVDPFVIETAFEDYEPEQSEYDRAKREAEKVIRQADGVISEKIIGRVARRLSSKGYGSDVIYSIIGDLRDEQNRENGTDYR